MAIALVYPFVTVVEYVGFWRGDGGLKQPGQQQQHRQSEQATEASSDHVSRSYGCPTSHRPEVYYGVCRRA